MPLPIIAWRTILRNSGATITASSTATGDFAASNVKNFRPTDIWKASSTTSPQDIDIDLGASGSADADSICLVNHNMVANGGQVTVYADAAVIGSTTVQAAYSPTSDVCDYKAFTAPGAKRYWRIRFSDPAAPFTTAPFCGVILLGLKMAMPEYVSAETDPFMDEREVIGNRSAGGNALGVTLRCINRRGVLRFGGDAGIVRTFLTSDFNAFLAQRYKRCEPWVLVLDSGDTDFAPARYLKKPDTALAPRSAVGGAYSRFVVPIAYEEAIGEAA